MARWLDRFSRLAAALMAAGLAAMVLLVFGNVVLRYGFDSGIAVSEEVSRWLFVWITFLGAIVALHERGHLGMDVVVARLPPRARRACLVAGHLLMLYVVWLLLQGSWALVRVNHDASAPASGWSMAILYAPGVVFAAVAALVLARDLWLAWTGRLADDELVQVRGSEDER